MESKIFIDINYASRLPQIVIHHKESDDPRDKLISMLTGDAMPGVRDGYCRIERYPVKGELEISVITPVHPVELVNHIPMIAKAAEDNLAYDTSGMSETYRSIIESECQRLGIGGVHPAEATVIDPDVADELKREAIKKADEWAVENLSTELYRRWRKDIYGQQPRLKSAEKSC